MTNKSMAKVNRRTNRKSAEKDSKTRLRLWLRLLKVSRSVEGQLRERIRTEFASTLPRFDVMAALSRYDSGLKMSELSQVLKVSNGNVTGIVDWLVEKGLVVRLAVPGDRRASLVRLTSKGKKEFSTQASAHENWIDEIFSCFSVAQSTELSDRLIALTQGDTNRHNNTHD